jgi:class 3 adenylate cyclase/type II secretory pathway pseudopilin PulG
MLVVRKLKSKFNLTLEDTMRQLISRIQAAIGKLVYKRIILAVTILFCVVVAVAMTNMSQLSSSLIASQALQNATLYAQSIREARALYSSDVINPLNNAKLINFTHDYNATKVTVPVPATFLIELGKNITEKNPEISVRLYSDYPFPWREKEGGTRDNFEREALSYLMQNPTQKFFRSDEFRGKPAFRYAEADILTASCINCHNTNSNSPKKDWKVGDVRGILEITQPLDTITQKTRGGLKNLFFLLAGLSVLGVSGLSLAISRLRQNAKQLEQRVRERTAELQETNIELVKEQEKSDRLLLNILPESIAAKLKDGQNSIADAFAEVTILFADIVGFTVLSSQISPEELLIFLNEIFSAFDSLTEKYGLEKIKTIGDAYMVVGGLPNPSTNHAESIAEMALDMREELVKFNTKHNAGINIRIGINTGPAIAGVIGTKKFIYDLWGDAVNTASRMESHGIPGTIQVTQSTYDILQNKYLFEDRGIIYVKGKGDMNTYLLTGRLVSVLSV